MPLKPLIPTASTESVPDVATEHLLPFGPDDAKVSAGFIKALVGKHGGNLTLVPAMNLTPPMSFVGNLDQLPTV